MYHNKLFLRSICQPLGSNAILNVSFLKSRAKTKNSQMPEVQALFCEVNFFVKKEKMGKFPMLQVYQTWNYSFVCYFRLAVLS